MNIDKTGLIKFSQEFISPYGTKMWVGIEMPFDPEKGNMDSVFQETMSAVRDYGELAIQTAYQNEVNYQSTTDNRTLPEIKVEKDPNPLLTNLSGIMFSQSKEELKTFRLVSTTNEILQEAYNKRHQELSK